MTAHPLETLVLGDDASISADLAWLCSVLLACDETVADPPIEALADPAVR